MNPEQAKFILSSGRRDERHAADPLFAEALRAAERDPALAAWFERSCAHDREIAAKLATIEPPAGLREAILAGGRASATRRKTRFLRATLAAAAALAVGISVSRWSATANAAEPTDLAKFALADSSRGWVHSHADSVQNQFERWLDEGGGRAGLPLPANLAQLQALEGCRVIDVAGRDVFEICFQHEGRWLHLYATRIEPGENLAPDARVATTMTGERCCATWVDTAHGYRVALVGSSDSPVFSRVL